jgi:3-oxoacyl-[acyl-carrier protein] reductase
LDLGLRDKVFVVTGSSQGLGRATAAALVAEDARVVLSARHEGALRGAVAGLREGRAAWVAADNADPATPQRLVAAALQEFGRLDGALISVGGPPGGAALAMDDDAWREAFETVFLGAVRLSRVVAAELPPGGALAFVLSSSVRVPIPGLALSNGLRPGLAGWAKTLADELGPRGIRVNGLLPGKMATGRVRELDARRGDPDEVRAANSETIPLRRYGEPAEFGAVAAFVLSPAASYLTGVMLPVDGGMLPSV